MLAQSPQLRPLRVLPGHQHRVVPHGVTRTHPGHTNDPSGAAGPATQGPEQLFTATGEGIALRDLCLPAPAGTATPKLKPARLGRGPGAHTDPKTGLVTGASPLRPQQARGDTSRPSDPVAAARQPLTSRLGARGRRYTLRRRERGGASPGAGYTAPPPPGPVGVEAIQCANHWMNDTKSFMGRLVYCI